MLRPSALANVFRLLMLGLLLTGIVLKPTLAIGEELHELLSHAVVAGDGHTHEDSHAVERAPAPDGQPAHDDQHFHLTHCCGQQAAVLPRLQFELPTHALASPIPAQSVAFASSPRTAPFRPPIAA